jgi:hypothetical protein
VFSSSYPIAHSDLEDRTVLLRPSLRYFCMIRAEFEQASKKRKARNFRESLDVWCICAVEQLVQEEAQYSKASNVNGYRHVWYKVHTTLERISRRGKEKTKLDLLPIRQKRAAAALILTSRSTLAYAFPAEATFSIKTRLTRTLQRYVPHPPQQL